MSQKLLMLNHEEYDDDDDDDPRRRAEICFLLTPEPHFSEGEQLME